jgi:diacylglycerol kinase family enzyme
MADDFQPRTVDTGRVNGRHFVSSSGIGLDASVVERVDGHPRLKRRLGEWYFTWAAVRTFTQHYMVKPPRVRLEMPEGSVDGVTVIIQNSDPFTYFGRHPIRICEGGGLDTGTLALLVLKRASLLEMPTLIPRVFSGRPESVLRHRQVQGFEPLTRFRVVTTDGRAFPLQVDGDFVGEFTEAEYEAAPASLTVVS